MTGSPRLVPMWKTVLLRRCPRCDRGAVLRGYAQTIQVCDACGLHLSTDPGSFLTGMAIAWGCSIALGIPAAFWLAGHVTDDRLLIATSAVLGISILVLIYPVAKAWSVWLHARIGELEPPPDHH